MSYYFNLEELRQEMSDSRFFSRRFETMLTFKLNSLKELCGRLPRENEAFFIETKKSNLFVNGRLILLNPSQFGGREVARRIQQM